MTDIKLDGRGLPIGYDFKPDWEVTPRETKAMLDAGEDFILVDCRKPDEWAITHIEQAMLLPLQQLPQLLQEKLAGQQDRKIIVHCKSGGRSMTFTKALRDAGFKDVKSMAGGILTWNSDINPGGPKY